MTDQPPVANPENAPVTPALIEQLGAGVTLEWQYNRRIPIITAERSTRDAIDVWLSTMPRLRAIWRESTITTALIYDLSNKQFGPTPYLRSSLETIRAEIHTHVPHIMAAIVSQTLFGEVFHAMSRLTPVPSSLRVKTFKQRDQALSWVIKALDESDAALRKA